MNEGYDHYIGVDWSIKNMAIARMTGKSNRVTSFERPADIKELQVYLKSLRGSIALTIEESTTEPTPKDWTNLKRFSDKPF